VSRARAHRATLVALLLLTLASPLAAQKEGADSGDSTRGGVVPDTSRGAVLRTIVVQAESIVARAAEAQPTSVLTRATINAAHARDASDVVALAPGAFVRQYGGLGGLRMLSLRGASAQQTIVLVDGIRYQSTAAGAVDLGSIPSSVLRRVEVVRGGDAARYGANALGGAVNLVVDPLVGAGASASVRADAGSFGERSLTIAGAAGMGAHAANGSVSITRFDGDYPFDYAEYGERSVVRRDNADLTSIFARAAWSHRVDDELRVGVSAIGFDSERGVPGAIVQGHREQLRARLAEREVFTTARASLATEEWQGLLAVSARANRLEYRDPDASFTGPAGIDNRYDRLESALLLRATRPLGADAYLEAATELAYARLDGDNLDPSVGSRVERLQWGVSTMASWSLVSLLPQCDLAIDAALRFDGFTDVASALSPSLGIVVRPGRGALRVRAHGSLNYRVPTFSEQYYLNYGNSRLRPERSTSADLGATYELFGSMVAEAGVFVIDTRDQIIAVPRSPVVWSAMNVARTLSRGLELSLSGTALEGVLALNASYTRMRAEECTPGPTEGNLLVYSPEELASGLVEVRFGALALGMLVQHTSHRHTLPSNSADAALAQYTLVGAHLRAHAVIGSLRLEARAELSNAFDESYEVVRSYPMPGRSVRIGLEVGYAAR
jgi:vitamin B12 transporter